MVPKQETEVYSYKLKSSNSKDTICIEVEVISKQEGFNESKQLRIQEMKLSDLSGSTNLTVWEDIRVLGEKFLSTSKYTIITQQWYC